MEHIIRIDVKDKIATKTDDTEYVCGNSDFEVHFTFDEEWNEYPVKTARFIPEKQPPIDVVFEGDVCPVPKMADTYKIRVGVYAGDQSTTTPAYVPAKKSILCGSGTPDDPPPDVYAQIMVKVNEAVQTADDVERRANTGEFDGKDGEDGRDGTDANVTAENISAALGYTPAKQEDVNSLNEDNTKLHADVDSLKDQTAAIDEAIFDRRTETADVLTYLNTPGKNVEVVSEIAHNAAGVTGAALTVRNKNFVSIIKKSITGSAVCTFTVADDGTYTLDNTAGTAMAYVNGESIDIIPGTYFVRVEVDEYAGDVVAVYLMESASDYSHGIQIRNGRELPAAVFKASSISTMIAVPAGAKVVFRLSAELGATEYTGYVKPQKEEYAVDFGKTVYGGSFNWTTGELIETMDSAGVALVSPAVTRLTENEIALYPDKNVLVSDTGATSVLTVESAVDPYKYQNYGLPILALTGDISGMDKDNAVTLDFVYGDRTGTCTCKWQGSSSLAYDKKNYTIKFDNAFEVVEGWGAQKKYCMKANWIDASHARNVVSAKMWGQIVKARNTPDERLSALPNGGAIDGFPCIITINGEFQGLFTWNIPKDGWMYGMGSGTQEAILCADAHVAATRFKGAATLNGDFELEYVSDENNADWVLTSLNRLINAVVNSDGSDLDTTIAQYLDWESAIDYYILTVLLRGDDMTDKNYLLYTYDGVKWHFGAYDMDCAWGLSWDGKTLYEANIGTTLAGYASIHRVMELIKTYKAAALKARYNALRAWVMSEDTVATTFGNFIGKIPSGIYDMERKRWPGVPLTSVNDLHQVTDWYRRRIAKIDAEAAAL